MLYKTLIKIALIFNLTSWFGHDFGLMYKLVKKKTGKPQTMLILKVEEKKSWPS